MAGPRLTPHQAATLTRLCRLARGDRWVPAAELGARGAAARLVAKGYAMAAADVGPRGGELVSYRPTAAGWQGGPAGAGTGPEDGWWRCERCGRPCPWLLGIVAHHQSPGCSLDAAGACDRHLPDVARELHHRQTLPPFEWRMVLRGPADPPGGAT